VPKPVCGVTGFSAGCTDRNPKFRAVPPAAKCLVSFHHENRESRVDLERVIRGCGPLCRNGAAQPATHGTKFAPDCGTGSPDISRGFQPVLAEGDAGCLKFALQRFVDQAPCVKLDDVVHVRTVLESRCSRITAMLTMHLKLM